MHGTTSLKKIQKSLEWSSLVPSAFCSLVLYDQMSYNLTELPFLKLRKSSVLHCKTTVSLILLINILFEYSPIASDFTNSSGKVINDLERI